MTKYIFVTGGVLSSLGKGLASAALGSLLESRGLSVTFQKLDPYLNVDPGTMSPFQHGEVYVTDDGAETDLDLGHYERFTDAKLTQDNNYTSGRIYKSVIEKERKGEYLGKTVQMIPHITDEIKNAILSMEGRGGMGRREVGGKGGGIEGLPFIESIRQLKSELNNRCILMHLTLVPYIKTADEIKTKPTQHSVRELLSYGLQPDIIICRCETKISLSAIKKISLFCNVASKNVISAVDVDNIYKLPSVLHNENLDDRVCDLLQIENTTPDNAQWKEYVKKIDVVNAGDKHVIVGIIGKYTELKEAYKSLHEALFHAGVSNNTIVDFKYIESEKLEGRRASSLADSVDCMLVPGGFGKRGTEGKIAAIRIAREQKIPFFGICLGMQLAAIEFARNVAGIDNATSFEFEKDSSFSHIITYMYAWHIKGTIEQRKLNSDKGGTLRLGAYSCELHKNTLAQNIYNTTCISERHRHRYEFNNAYMSTLVDAGLVIAGMSKNKDLVEIIEIKNHPWFIGCQFHPEFKSTPLSPHPLFVSFIAAAKKYQAHRIVNNYS